MIKSFFKTNIPKKTLKLVQGGFEYFMLNLKNLIFNIFHSILNKGGQSSPKKNAKIFFEMSKNNYKVCCTLRSKVSKS